MCDDTTSYGFLCGADMNPTSIRRNAAIAEARFVDIGSVPATEIASRDLPLPGAEQVWGVVVTLPGEVPDTSQVLITLRRTGEVVQAEVLTDAASFGDRDAVVAEAYYWELPRSWREALDMHLDDSKIAKR